MRRQIAVLMCSAVLGFMTLSSHAIAQQKTVKACQEEWRANKATNQTNGVTEKAYVAQCRGGSAPAQTTAAPAAPTAPAPTAALAPGQKTAGACRDEWRANKAANQANGITEKAYVAQCRSGAGPIQTTAAPAAPPAPAPTVAPATGQKTAEACRDEWRANKAANQANGTTEKAYVAQCRGGTAPIQTTAAPAAPPAPAPSTAPTTPAPAPTASAPPSRPLPTPAPAAGPAPNPGNPAGANQFSTEAQAKYRCPTGTVVWVNLKSKVYHFSGTRFYGNTEHGAYMCESDTSAEGMRAAKNETHP
jgi:hypothetical protein